MDKEKFGGKSQNNSAKLSWSSICMLSSQLLRATQSMELGFLVVVSVVTSASLIVFNVTRGKSTMGPLLPFVLFVMLLSILGFFLAAHFLKPKSTLDFQTHSPRKKNTHNYKDQIPNTSWMKTRRCELVWLQGGMPHWGLLVLNVSDINIEEAWKFKRVLSLSCYLLGMQP